MSSLPRILQIKDSIRLSQGSHSPEHHFCYFVFTLIAFLGSDQDVRYLHTFRSLFLKMLTGNAVVTIIIERQICFTDRTSQIAYHPEQEILGRIDRGESPLIAHHDGLQDLLATESNNGKALTNSSFKLGHNLLLTFVRP
jgi:hypothetical protein